MANSSEFSGVAICIAVTDIYSARQPVLLIKGGKRMLEIIQTKKVQNFTDLSCEGQRTAHQIHYDALVVWMEMARQLHLVVTHGVESGNLSLLVTGWLIEI